MLYLILVEKLLKGLRSESVEVAELSAELAVELSAELAAELAAELFAGLAADPSDPLQSLAVAVAVDSA